MKINPRRQPADGRRADGGFTLTEVLVAISLIGTMMAALTPFFVTVLAATDHQRTRQVAIQLAGDAVERARALKGSALLAGRGRTASENQWAAAPAAVAPYLSRLTLDWDTLVAAGAGSAAPLPTTPVPVMIGGKRYEQHWYVGRCHQQGGPSGGADRDCTPTGAPDTDPRPNVPMFGVVVAVTWSHRTCPAERCAYAATTLFSNTGDPVFNTERPPPAVTVGDQHGYVGVAVNLPLTATGGQLPLTWAITGLPAGLTLISPASGVVGGTPTLAAVGAHTVRVTVTDQAGDSDTRQFTWHIYRLPALGSPGDRTSLAGATVSVPFAGYLTGGRPDVSWSATGLPTGLAIDADTGEVTGTPTTAGPAQPVRLTVTDGGGRTASVDFTWRITGAWSIPGQTTALNGSVNLTPTPPAGLTPARWWAENLPVGLSIDASTGRISGTPDDGTRYVTTVYVATAGDATVASATFVWDVTTSANSEVFFTAPSTGTADRTGRVGQAVSFPVTADGPGNSGLAWHVTGLPPGVSMSGSGNTRTVSGTPNTPGYYLVKITADHSGNKQAYFMFRWTVTP